MGGGHRKLHHLPRLHSFVDTVREVKRLSCAEWTAQWLLSGNLFR